MKMAKTKQAANAVTLQYIPFEDLVFLENNPRTRTPDGLQKMAADIAADPTFYQNRPTLVNLVDGGFYVYAGDLRAHAAHDVLGWAAVPCNVEADVPADVQKRRAIVDNTHREDWDAGKLAEWGYEPEELEDMGVWLEDEEGYDSEGGVPNNALNSEKLESDPFDDPGVVAKNQFGVIVLCDGEALQAEIYERLTGEGLSCKIVVV